MLDNNNNNIKNHNKKNGEEAAENSLVTMVDKSKQFIQLQNFYFFYLQLVLDD